MKNDNVFTYTLLWKFRYYISFFIVGLMLFLVFYFLKGMNFIINNIFSLFFIWCVIGVSFFYSAFRERVLIKKIEIFGDRIKIEKENNKIYFFNLSEIKKIKITSLNGSINGFGVKEMIIYISDDNHYVIPMNVRNFNLLYDLIKIENQ